MNKEYLAGLFDGEGCVTTGIHGKGMRARAAICMSNAEDLFKEIQSEYKGSVWKDKRGYWHYQVHSANSVRFFSDILPFLRIKKEQAKLAVELQSGIFPNGGKSLSEKELIRRKALAKKIKDLKRPLGELCCQR